MGKMRMRHLGKDAYGCYHECHEESSQFYRRSTADTFWGSPAFIERSSVNLGICISLQGGWIPGAAEEASFDSVRRIALFAEEVGFDSLWLPDHLLNPIHGERAPCLEGWTVAAAVAPLTSRVKIAHPTLSAAFRHPAVLAKQAATLQEISGGRFWLGLGAGFFEPEFRSYGLPWAEHGARIARVREALEVIRRLFSEETVDFLGDYYALENGTLEPKPRPRPLIWYGGDSEPSREVAADLADGWLTIGRSPEDVRSKLADMDERIRRRGRRTALRIGVLTGLVFVGKSAADARDRAHRLLSPEETERALSDALVGGPETVARQIEQYARLGVDQLILRFHPGLESLERFAELMRPYSIIRRSAS
jgi:FMNH2-dependent dimethyl sulfone monooxygenase